MSVEAKTAFLEKYPDEKDLVHKFEVSVSSHSSEPIGYGVNSSVTEVIVSGSVCAAKHIRDEFIRLAKKPSDFVIPFLRECQLMSIYPPPPEHRPIYWLRLLSRVANPRFCNGADADEPSRLARP